MKHNKPPGKRKRAASDSSPPPPALEAENRRLRGRLEQTQRQLHLLQATIDQLPTPVYYKNTEGAFTGCNAAFEKINGITQEDLIGKTVFDFLPPEGTQQHRDADQAVLAGAEVHVYESSLRSLDGTQREALFQKSLLRDPQGNPVGLVGAIVDITDHKRAEEALRRSEERLRLIFEHSNDGINMVEFDLETSKRRLLMCNDRYVEMSGYSREQLMAANDLNELVQPYEDPQRGQEEYRKILRGIPFTGRNSWIRPDGKENHYEWTAASVRIDQKICILGIDRDITEHLRADRELAESREIFSTFMEQLPGIALIKDDHSRLQYANSYMRDLFGLKEYTGLAVRDYLPPEVASPMLADDQEALAGNAVIREEWVSDRHGRPRWFRTRKFSIRRPGQSALIGVVSFNIDEMKRTEDALRSSEQRYRGIVEDQAELVCRSLPDTTLTFANKAYARYFDARPEELIGRKFLDFIPPDTHPRVLSHLAKLGTDHLTDRHEHQVIDATGQVRWHEWANRAILDESGRVVEIQSVGRDVTELRLAEHALRESQQRLQSIIDNSRDIIFQIDLDGNYTFTNAAAERITGYPPEELLRMSMYQLVAPEYHAGLADRIRKRRAGEELTQPFNFEITHKDGRRLFLELTTAPVYKDGELAGIQGIARDITEMKLAETDLRDSEQRYRTLVSNVPGAVYRCECDPEWGVRVISNGIRDISGYPSEEFIANRVRSYTSIIHPDDRTAVEEAVLDGVSRRQPYIIEYRILHADGSVRWVWDKARGVFDDKGNLLWLDGVIIDDTERKRAEEILRTVHHQLMWSREEERRRLAAELHDSIGQDLIAFHVGLRGALAKIREKLSDDQTAEMSKAVDRCLALIRDVRVISHGLYPPTLESLGLASALRQLAGELADQYNVQVDIAEELKSARLPAAVEIALFRISQEAVQNSLRHSKADRVDIKLQYEDGRLLLGITDDGIGFDPEAAIGNGLGLTTMKERADAIGGQLRFDSGCGGTRVEVRVPVTLAGGD